MAKTGADLGALCSPVGSFQFLGGEMKRVLFASRKAKNLKFKYSRRHVIKATVP